MSGHIQTAERTDWCTPVKIISAVREVFGDLIYLDPCDNGESVVGAVTRYRLPDNDGLLDSWDFKSIYVNPPYGTTYMHKDTKRIYNVEEYKKLVSEGVLAASFRKNTIADWIKRCDDASEADYGREIVALIPAATDTGHWDKWIWGSADSVCFVKGRLRFIGAAQGAPFASACVYWGPRPDRFTQCFAHIGRVVSPQCCGFCN